MSFHASVHHIMAYSHSGVETAQQLHIYLLRSPEMDSYRKRSGSGISFVLVVYVVCTIKSFVQEALDQTEGQ